MKSNEKDTVWDMGIKYIRLLWVWDGYGIEIQSPRQPCIGHNPFRPLH